ncbi:Vacuolar protein sorting-associated protein 70 [Bienertia sinuspersici]
MGYTYTPAYYSSLQDSITSICKTILPFSFKKRRITAAEQKLSKQQSDNLKWQQNSFHQILNLMGLQKEGILPDSEVSAFRTHLLDTLIAAKGAGNEQPAILRDKLLFLQELLHAKCISAEEYHASKRPLLQRLAVQGAELEASDVIVGTPEQTEISDEEEWSVIDLRDEQSLINKSNSKSKNKTKHGLSAVKHIKDAASVLGFRSYQKLGRNKEQKSIFDLPATSNQFPVDDSGRSNIEEMQIDDNPFWNNTQSESKIETKSILMSENLASDSDKFVKGGCHETNEGKNVAFQGQSQADKSAKKQWGFDGLKRWKKGNVEDETTRFPLSEKSRNEGPYIQGPDTKQKQRKLLSDGSSSGFYIDKVVGDNIKKELSRIQTELSSTNPNFRFSNDQMDGISSKLPVDKTDLKQFFPKSWCDRYGDVVLDVVKKEFKNHVGEMEDMRNAARERRYTSSKRWTTFEDDDENCHPNHTPPANKHRANSIFF